jgi:hypothetical protein
LLRNTLTPLRAQLDALDTPAFNLLLTVNPELRAERDEMRFTVQSLGVAVSYFEEAIKCINNEIYFAGAVLGSAMLESMLIALVLLKKDEIKSSAAFGIKFSKTPEAVLEFIKRADLGSLLEVAQRLDWFRNDRIPSVFEGAFISRLESDAKVELRGILTGIPDLGVFASSQARRFRNLIHPGLCLREGIDLDSADAKLACLYLIFAFSTLIENKLVS